MTVPAGERRVVSVLVADVAGSTTIAEQLGPERSKYLFDEVVALMREEVERFGGTVAQLTGDGVLALFGAPTAHEDDSERAVRAALALREALGRYGAEVGPAYGIELGARVAVNTGPVVIPAGDAPADVLYNALGDTVNVAARLQTLGELVIGPETARQVGAGFELEPLGDVELKGKADPVAAFQVAGERVRPVETAITPLVGREAELEILEGVLAGLVDGRGAIVVVTGEPGIGKSRLKSEARNRFADRVRFLEGHAVAYAHEIPYWPFREVLRDWLGLGVSDVEARVRLELRAGLAGALGDEADDAYPFLATLLGIPLEREQSERLGELSRDSVQQQTFDAFGRLVSALARERPLCLVLEDLHWADEATLALIEELFGATDEEVVLVLTYRTEDDHGAWALAEQARRRYRHRFEALELAPLEQGTAVELAAGAAGAALPDPVAALLAERSGGNPFFLEEALRDLIERGVLRRDNGSLVLANGGEVAVPSLVQEALQARLDRLDPGTREVINVASVAGRSFGMPLLEQLIDRDRLRPALSELQRLDLVVEERRRPTAEYRFRHGLVQEVAYGGLVETRRRELHRVVGDALEQLHRDAPEEVYGLLARHFSEADEPNRALEYLVKAGDAARAAYADEEAVELYRRALSYMGRAGDEQRARDTLLRIALTHHLAFDYERAGAAYGEAFAIPAPPPARLEPAERITVPAPFPDGYVPGRGYNEYSWELMRDSYRGLVRIGPRAEIVPDLAESFAVSADGTTYRFRLVPDVLWSDGTPVTADDFAFTYQAMRDEHVQTATLLDDVASAEALDARTLELRLHEPRSYFLYLVGQPAFFPWPRHVYNRLGSKWHESTPLVGNGPFVLTRRDEAALLLTASPTWIGARGNIREIRVELADDRLQNYARWQDHEFDAYPLGRLESPDSIVLSSPGLATAYLAFNCDRPHLGDPLVRRALAHALDRDGFAARFSDLGDSARAGGLIPPTMPGHTHRLAPAYDPQVARALLADAGHDNGRGFPPLTIGHITGYDASGLLDEQFGAVGIRVQVVNAPLHEFEALIRSGLDAFVWAWAADVPDPAGMISPLLATVPGLYRDGRVDRLLARARSLRDRDMQLATYRKADRLLVADQAAVVPLQYFRRTSLVRPWVDGFWQNALVTSSFAEVVVRPELRSAPTPA
jgi:ABC-type transport system substrate-binding protein/class 3 adenylate cyclase